MGIFSDRCDALVDANTGKALSGAALEEARQQRKWPRCRNRVSKAARFCNVCGRPAPGGWWKCPACGKWVGNASSFCAHCDTPLHPETRVDMAGGVWQKGQDVLAQRFEVGDVSRLLKNGMQVQSGTVAILLDAGKVSDTISSGRYDPDSLGHKINWFGNPPPRSVILVDEGDVALPLRLEGLRSAEQMELEFYGEIILQFNRKHAENFVSNLFKSAEAMPYSELSDRLAGEIRHAVDAMCVASTIDDLVRDPQRRIRLEDTLAGVLKVASERYGFDVVRVSQCEFTGDAYEELVEKQGEVEATRRRVELDQRLLEMLDKEKMGQFKSEHDLNEYVAQLAQERGVSELHRDRELAVMQTAWRRQDDLEEQRHAMVLEREANSQKLGLTKEWDDYNREKLVDDAGASASARNKTFEQEVVETEWALKMRAEKELQKQKALSAMADTMKGRTLQELIVLIDDPQKRKDLLAMHDQEVRSGMSEKQILAMAVEKSPAAAEALARMAGLEKDDSRERVEDMRKMMKEMLDRDERILKTAVEPGVEAARNQTGSTQQIIK